MFKVGFLNIIDIKNYSNVLVPIIFSNFCNFVSIESNIPPPLMIEYNGLTDEIRELREELQSLKKTNITQ